MNMEKLFVLSFLLWVFTEFALSQYMRRRYPNHLFIIPALVGVFNAGYNMYKSDQQKKLAGKLQASNYVPPGLREAETSQQRQALATVSPGYNRAKERLSISTSNSINNAKRIGGTAGQIQQAAADADVREKEAVKDLEVNNDAYRLARTQELNQTRKLRGGYEAQSNDAKNAAQSALLGASEQNQYNALTGLAEGFVNQYYDSKGVGSGQVSGSNPNAPQAGSGRNGLSILPKAGSAEEQIAQLQSSGFTLSEMDKARIRNQYSNGGFKTGY